MGPDELAALGESVTERWPDAEVLVEAEGEGARVTISEGGEFLCMSVSDGGPLLRFLLTGSPQQAIT